MYQGGSAAQFIKILTVYTYVKIFYLKKKRVASLVQMAAVY